MLPVLRADVNLYGSDVAGFLPSADDVTGVFGLSDRHARIWERAAPYLRVRSNDGHSIYAYGIAKALCDLYPRADPEVVLPGILLHDTGWSQVPEDEVLEAIAPGAGRHDLVILHEKEGARIAAEILVVQEWDATRTEEIVAIIDGHDTRTEALSLNDALLKDADKLWRLTPHGVDTIMGWFGLDRRQAHLLIASRVHDQLFTEAGRTMARVLGAVVSIDTLPQRIGLG